MSLGRDESRLVAGALAALLLVAGGCRTRGPDFVAPRLDAPPFRNTVAVPDAGAASSGGFGPAAAAPLPSDGAWWAVFHDATLSELEAAALAQSPTLGSAVARVDEARARFGIVRADTRIGVGASGSARLAGETAEREIPVPGRTLTYRERGDFYRAAADAGFELDLWGRVKRSLESARAQVDASEADLRAVRLVLTADVAQAYFAWRALVEVGDVLSRTVAARRDAVDVLRVRFDAGLSPELDLNRARVEVASLDAEMAEVARRREQALNALAVLTGRPPGAFPVQALPAGAAQSAPPTIPPGLPSALLQRRPDLAASAALLRARTAEIGVAEAAQFPTIRLTGSAGFESLELGSLLGRPSQFWQVGPSVSLPLFDGGKTRANIRGAEARFAAAAADYRLRALQAFREVEDALVDLRQQAEQAAAQSRAAEAAAAVVTLATTRYERGFATYLDVIDAQRTALQIERAQAEITSARRASTVRLIRALGGGWE